MRATKDYTHCSVHHGDAISRCRPARGLAARSCKIHVFDPFTHMNAKARAPPSGWDRNQLSTATWLHRSLANHPWKAPLEEADAVFIDADFSVLCRPVVPGKQIRWIAQRKLWMDMSRMFPELWRWDAARRSRRIQ